jgi:hypothetical protein
VPGIRPSWRLELVLWQPSMSRSISDSGRYWRVPTSAFLGRRGVTFRFTAAGGTILRVGVQGRRSAKLLAACFGTPDAFLASLANQLALVINSGSIEGHFGVKGRQLRTNP